MPRRNQDDSERRKPSRSGGRTGSKRQRPFRPGDKENRSSSSGTPFRNRKDSTSSPRPRRNSGSSDKPFKPSAARHSRTDDGKTFGKSRPRPRGESGTKNFSQRSRFAKDSRGDSDRGSKKFSREGPRPESGDGTFDRRNRSLSVPSAKPPSVGNRREGRGERGASFGKPYKKIYKSKPARSSEDLPPRRSESETAPKSDKIRLNKFIANSGVCSRREADELITMGLISVNGTVVTELGYKVNPGDEVRYESKVLRAEKPVYILMNKPKGFLTTTDDPQERKTVMQIIGASVKERIYPVGRLDRNTTGLLMLTNDGDLADKLMHPSFNVRKVYKVELDKPLTKADFQTITEGVKLEEGRATVDDLALVSPDGRTVGIELHIGWNRVVRRIFESLGYEVVKLDRTVYAGLDKKDLARGQWRFLTKEEIIHLKHFK